jgi:2-polyprenyl-3-methyl-5-hydroxy-6-metoxy-1,4-benzoquinol methylase
MSCHLCDAPLSNAVTVGTTARHGDSVRTVACGWCGLVQTMPLPSEAELTTYYNGPYREKFKRDSVRTSDGAIHAWGSPEAEALLDAAANEYAKGIAEACVLDSTSEVLEVGAGDFRMSRAIARATDANVSAIEPDETLSGEHKEGILHYAMSLAEFVEPGDDVDLSSYVYDAVVSIHSLEHFREPIKALSQMRSRLKFGGRIWVEVPNVEEPYGDLDTHYWQFPHLYNFSAATLRASMLRAGFDDVRVAVSGHVLHAVAVNRGSEELPFERLPNGNSEMPDGNDVAAMLQSYRETRASQLAGNKATATLMALRAGRDVSLDDVREAVEVLGEQSLKAVRMATRAINDGAALVAELDNAIMISESNEADAWQRGFAAGEASMASRCSHAVGNMVNALKMIEVGK